MTTTQLWISIVFWVVAGLSLQSWNAYDAFKAWPHRLTVVAAFLPIPGTTIFFRSLICWIPHIIASFLFSNFKDLIS